MYSCSQASLPFSEVPTKKLHFNIVDVMRQRNIYDCGIHAIAIATDLAFNKDPAKSQWDIGKLRSHLVGFLKGKKMVPFPVKGDVPSSKNLYGHRHPLPVQNAI